jgi:hypothetical protein
VGGLLGPAPVGTILNPVAGAVDETLGGVVGSLGPLPDGGVLPQLPTVPLLPGGPGGPGGPGEPGGPGTVPIPPSSVPSVTAAEPTLAATAMGPPARAGTDARSAGDAALGAQLRAPHDPAPPNAPNTPLPGAPSSPALGGAAGGTAAGSGSAGASTSSDAALAAVGHEANASLALSTVNDELPSSPVFETDTTPD